MNLAKDHPATLEFALQSGKLLQNFGVVELTSYRWIAALSGNLVAVEISRDVPLAKRIDIVLKLIDRDAKSPPEKKEKARALWKQLKNTGCPLRNIVAHGTVGLSITGDDPGADPQWIGVLKINKWTDTDELVSLEELKGAVNTTAKIVEELNLILGEDA
jgi:hypothetical protein